MTKVNGSNNVSAEYQVVNGKKVKKQEQPKNQKQVFNNQGQKTPKKPNDSAVKQEIYKKTGFQLKDTKDRGKIIQLKVNGKLRPYETVGTLTTGGRILVKEQGKEVYHVVSHTKDNQLVMLKDDYAKNKIFFETTSAQHKVKIGKKDYVITNSKRDRHGRMEAVNANGQRVVLSSDGKELKQGYVEAEDQKDNMNDYIARATKGKSKAEAAKIRQQIMDGNASYSNKGVMRFKASNGEVWYYDTKRKTYVKYAGKEAQAIIQDLDKGAKENWLLFRTGWGTDYELLKKTNAQIIDPEVLSKVNEHYSAEYGKKVDKNAEYGSGKYRSAYEAFLASEIGDDEVYLFNATLVKNNAITDQSRRNEILKTNLTKVKGLGVDGLGIGVSKRTNRMAAADAASSKEDYQALQDAAEEENKKNNYKPQFKGSDALQTYIYGVNKGDVQEVDDFNTTLIKPNSNMLDRDEVVRIKAETGALWLQQGNFKKGFEAQDTDVANKMFELQNANGKTALNAQNLKKQAAEKHQEDYMMMARPDLYSDKELAAKATQLLKDALSSLNTYNTLQSQLPTYSTTGGFNVNAQTEVTSYEAAREDISRAYSMIRNDKVLAMVKEQMGNDFNILAQKEQEHLKTGNLKNVTVTDNKLDNSKLSPEEIAHNKYVVTWLKSQVEELEREHKLGEAKEGWKQDFVNGVRELSFGGETRASLANNYQLVKSNMARLEAAAEGKLVDASGKPVSFEDAMKNLGDASIQALEQANQDYQTQQMAGEFMVDMVTLAIPLPTKFTAGNTILKIGNTLYKVVSKSDKACKVIKVTQEAVKGSKILDYTAKVAEMNPKLVNVGKKVAKVADSSATAAMHMEVKTAALEVSNIATSREGFSSDRISEMNEKVKSAGMFGGMGGAIGGTTGTIAEFVSSKGAKYAVHTLGLAADMAGAAGLMTAESHGETNFWDNLRCVNPDGSFNYEQALMTGMMIYGHLHGMSGIKGKSKPHTELQADGTYKVKLGSSELTLNKDGIWSDSNSGREFRLAKNKDGKTVVTELSKKEVKARHVEQPVTEDARAKSARHSERSEESHETSINSFKERINNAKSRDDLNAIRNDIKQSDLTVQERNELMAESLKVQREWAQTPERSQIVNMATEGEMPKMPKAELDALRKELGIRQSKPGLHFEGESNGNKALIYEKKGNEIVNVYQIDDVSNNAHIATKITSENGKATDVEIYNADGTIKEMPAEAKQTVLAALNKPAETAPTRPSEPVSGADKPVTEDIKPSTVTTPQVERTGNTAEQAAAIHQAELKEVGTTPVRQSKAQQRELERLQTLVQSNEGKAILAEAMKDPNFGKPLSERVPDEGFKTTEDGRLQIEVDGVVYTEPTEGSSELVSSDGKRLQAWSKEPTTAPSATNDPNLTVLYWNDSKILRIENQYGAVDNTSTFNSYHPAGKTNTYLRLLDGRTVENTIMTDNVGRVIYNEEQSALSSNYYSKTVNGSFESDSNVVRELNQAIQDVNLKNTTFSSRKGRQKAYEDVRTQIDNSYKADKLTGSDYDKLVTTLNAKAEEAGGLIVRETSNQRIEAAKSKRYESVRKTLSDQIDGVATQADYDMMSAKIDGAFRRGQIDANSASILNKTLDTKGELIEGVETLSQKKAKIETQVREIENAQRAEEVEANSQHRTELLDEYLAEFGKNLPSEIGTKEYYNEALSTIDRAEKNGSIEPQKAEVLRTQAKEQLAKLEPESNQPATGEQKPIIASEGEAGVNESHSERSEESHGTPKTEQKTEPDQPVADKPAVGKDSQETPKTEQKQHDVEIPTRLSDVDSFVNEYPDFVKSEVDGVVKITNKKANLTIEYEKSTGKKLAATQVDQNGFKVRNTFDEDGNVATMESEFEYEGNRYQEKVDFNEGTKSYKQILDKNTGISTEVAPELAKKFAEGTVEAGKFTPKAEEVFNPYEVVEQNAEGKPTKTALKDADGNVLEYNYNEYDSNGNVAKTTARDVDGKVTASHEFEYDNNHNLTKETVKDAEGNITGVFDGEGNPLKTESNQPVAEKPVVGENETPKFEEVETNEGLQLRHKVGDENSYEFFNPETLKWEPTTKQFFDERIAKDGVKTNTTEPDPTGHSEPDSESNQPVAEKPVVGEEPQNALKTEDTPVSNEQAPANTSEGKAGVKESHSESKTETKSSEPDKSAKPTNEEIATQEKSVADLQTELDKIKPKYNEETANKNFAQAEKEFDILAEKVYEAAKKVGKFKKQNPQEAIESIKKQLLVSKKLSKANKKIVKNYQQAKAEVDIIAKQKELQAKLKTEQAKLDTMKKVDNPVDNQPATGEQKPAPKDQYPTVPKIEEVETNQGLQLRHKIGDENSYEFFNPETSNWEPTTKQFFDEKVARDGSKSKATYQNIEQHDGSTIQRFIDADGKKIKKIFRDSNGKITSSKEYEYDANGKMSKKILKNADGKVWSATEYKYNEAGKRTEIINRDGKDNVINSTVYKYNESGNQTEIIYKGEKGNVTDSTEYKYNESGKQTKIINKDKDGNITSSTEYKYDANGNKSLELVKDEKGEIISYEEYKYSVDGKLSKTVGGLKEGKITVYDEEQRRLLTPEETNSYIKESLKSDIENVTKDNVDEYKAKADNAKENGIITEEEYINLMKKAGEKVKTEEAAQIHSEEMNNVEPTPTARDKNLEKYDIMFQSKEGKAFLDEAKKDPNFGKTAEERVPSDKIVKDADGNIQSIEIDGVTYTRNEQGKYVNGDSTADVSIVEPGSGGIITIGRPDKKVVIEQNKIKEISSKDGVSVSYDTTTGQPSIVSVSNGSLDFRTGEIGHSGSYTTDSTGKVVENNISIDINGRKYDPNASEGYRYSDWGRDTNGNFIDYNLRIETENNLSKLIEDTHLENRGLRTTKKGRQKAYDDLRNQIEDAYNNNKIDRETADNLHTKLNEKAEANGLETQETPTMKAEREVLAKVDTLKDSLMSDIEKVDSQTAHDQMVEKIGEACKNGEIDMKRANELYDALETKAKSIDGVESLAQKADRINAELKAHEGELVPEEPLRTEEAAEAETGSTPVEEKPVPTDEGATPTTDTEEGTPQPTNDAKPSKISRFDKLFHKNKVKLENEVEAGEVTVGDYKYNTQRDENGYVRTKTDNETNVVEQKEYFDAKGKKIRTEKFDTDGNQSELTEGKVTTRYNEDGLVSIVEYPNRKSVELLYDENGQLTGAEYYEDHYPLHPKNWNASEYLAQKRRTNYDYNPAEKRFELKNDKGEVVGTATFDPETRHWVEQGKYKSDLAPKTTNVSQGENGFRARVSNTTKNILDRFRSSKNRNEDGTKIPKKFRGRDDVTYDSERKEYIEKISKDGQDIQRVYDSKGTLLRENIDNKKTVFYNEDGVDIAVDEQTSTGLKRTEKSKDYDLEIQMDPSRNNQKATIKYHEGHEPKENGTKIDSKEYAYEDGKFVSKKDGKIVETLEYNADKHTWEIKDAEGKTIEKVDNLKTLDLSKKTKTVLAGLGTIGAIGGVVGAITQLNANQNNKDDEVKDTKNNKVTKPQTTTPKPSNKVTLGDQEGTIDADGTITIGGEPYPKNADGTYTIGGKNYNLEDGKLVEANPETPDPAQKTDTDGADGASDDGETAVTGTINGKDYTIKDGTVTIDGKSIVKADDGYYEIDGKKYQIGDDGKLVEVETQSADNTSGSDSSSQTGSADTSTSQGGGDRTGSTGGSTQQGSGTRTGSTDGSTQQGSGTRTGSTGGTTRHSEQSEESRANSTRRSEQSEESRANSTRHSERSEESRRTGNTPVTDATEPTEAQKQVAATLQNEISNISTRAEVQAFFAELDSAVKTGQITIKQCDELMNLVKAHVETLVEADRVQDETSSETQTVQPQGDVTTSAEPKRTKKREITPMERMELTEKIRKAKNKNEIAAIQQEMRQYKVFQGRKNMRRAYKAKLRAIKHQGEPKYDNKFDKRMEKIENSKVYKEDVDKIRLEKDFANDKRIWDSDNFFG